ncbi:hypothetical protein JKG47_03540 [Acidithiobacillus sp. MC6.1]|nr:hypothetical protein [Acidithiobacillus sp. MC6.1]
MSLEKIKQIMVENGISTIDCEYEGSGDSGNIESVAMQKADGSEFHDSGVESKISNLAWGIIGEKHAGFENNDGGYGIMRFSLVDDGELKLEWEHNDYYTEVNTSVHNMTV